MTLWQIDTYTHIYSCGLSARGGEAAIFRDDEAQAQTPEEEKEEGPQRAHQASVSLRPLLQRHSGGHKGAEPQCHLRRRLQNCGIHVGRTRGGAKTGTFRGGVEEKR